MYKCMALLRKRADISREQFEDYYRHHHAVLIRRLLPGLVDYRSNFIDLAGAFVFPDAAPIDFDVITEMWFEDRAAYERFVAKAAEPAIAEQIARDEEHLFERGASRMFVVDEQRWIK
ncbi:MAG: EthD domain-containing protein [Comamonas sp.]